MPNKPSGEDLLTADELAEALSVHTETVNRWSRERKIPFISLPGGYRRYLLSDVIAARKQPGADSAVA